MNTTEFLMGKVRVRFVQGDITDMETDAVVNAANSSLMGGGGVDGAIHRRGGPRILEECKRIRAEEWPDGLPTGKAVITSGGNLKARYVIHTVGPVWRGGDHHEPELLADAYRNSLKLAEDKGLRTIAFPSVSTGAYGFPIEQASQIALRTVISFLQENHAFLEIVFVLFSDRDFEMYLDAAQNIFR
jgi:O-acetyl-ADP-ribose deacetylase (regulator of RNase III)